MFCHDRSFRAFYVTVGLDGLDTSQQYYDPKDACTPTPAKFRMERNIGDTSNTAPMDAHGFCGWRCHYLDHRLGQLI